MSNHHYILCIETSTTVCSVVLAADNEELSRKEINEANIHASALTLFIEEVLENAQVSIGDLSAVAVSKGPGSYTGLRIGVSVAKGMCYALDIPLISVDTLGAMASGFVGAGHNVWGDHVILCPMIDARRSEVYTKMLTARLDIQEDTKALIVDADTFLPQTEQGMIVVLFGNGADKFADLFQDNYLIQVFTGFEGSASHLVVQAFEKFQQGIFEDVAYFEPFYLKDFVGTMPKKRV